MRTDNEKLWELYVASISGMCSNSKNDAKTTTTQAQYAMELAKAALQEWEIMS